MKGRMAKATGGANGANMDLAMKPNRRNHAPLIEDAADERKAGGCTKRKAGGLVPGKACKANAGRMPRKSGGRATSDMNPFTSARKGTPPKGHTTDGSLDG